MLRCHAKSSQVRSNINDIDGPLNSRGCGASREIAQLKSEEGLTADLILCSSARCARETLDRLVTPSDF